MIITSATVSAELTQQTFGRKEGHQLTAPTKNWRFSAPQTHLWLIKHWFSASTFVVKIATFAKPQTVRLSKNSGTILNKMLITLMVKSI